MKTSTLNTDKSFDKSSATVREAPDMLKLLAILSAAIVVKPFGIHIYIYEEICMCVYIYIYIIYIISILLRGPLFVTGDLEISEIRIYLTYITTLRKNLIYMKVTVNHS